MDRLIVCEVSHGVISSCFGKVILLNMQGIPVDFRRDVKKMLDDVLHLGGRALSFDDETTLLGSVPELDSMAVIALITAIEERFLCSVDDDEIDGSVFATVGSLTHFVAEKAGLSLT